MRRRNFMTVLAGAAAYPLLAGLVEKARKVEALGYATLTLPDHLTDRIAPVPALAIAAEATRHVRVGTNVLNNDLRHPTGSTSQKKSICRLLNTHQRAVM
jgi:alkanesulfonate monooxygenase SsuD/methylene tetrahydromethanopterin reductase-like flavin-dependent oxidoreductase (luciferase family)